MLGGLLRITVLPMKTISFKVSEAEERIIRQRAKRERISVSEYLRRKAAGNEASGMIGKVRCSITGAEIFAPMESDPPFTTERVREMLADFP